MTTAELRAAAPVLPLAGFRLDQPVRDVADRRLPGLSGVSLS
jgi:hypothetical protein